MRSGLGLKVPTPTARPISRPSRLPMFLLPLVAVGTFRNGVQRQELRYPANIVPTFRDVQEALGYGPEERVPGIS